jgi:hypothetical protein
MSLQREQRFSSCAEMEQALLRCFDVPYIDPTVGAVAPTVAATPPPVKPTPPPPVKPTPPPPVKPTPQVTAEDGTPCVRCGRVNKGRARFCAGCGAPLAEPPKPRLMITSPHRSWELPIDRLPVRIGRRDPRQNHYPELDLAEHDRGIASRHHATIQRDGDFYTLTDLGSTNGTMLNSALIIPRVPQRLTQGDRIKIGEVEIEFRWS